MTTGEKIRNTREDMDILQQELANAIGMNVSVLSRIEKGTRAIRDDELVKIAQKLQVTTDYLLGNTQPKQGDLPPLTQKDERQISRDLENMLDSLNGAAAMSDDPEDEEDREMLKAALLHAMTLSKRMAKKKFTPKKYRHED